MNVLFIIEVKILVLNEWLDIAPSLPNRIDC